LTATATKKRGGGARQGARSPLEDIPPPETIRERIARLYWEARQLRKLLGLSETLRRHTPARPSGEGGDGRAA
jgi:hypothetical protein